MKDKQGEWNAEGPNPLRIKIPRRAAQNNTDIYATVEWFYCQGSGDEHGKLLSGWSHFYPFLKYHELGWRCCWLCNAGYTFENKVNDA